MSLVLLQPTDNLIHTTMSPDSGVLVASFHYGFNTYTIKLYIHRSVRLFNIKSLISSINVDGLALE
jgi:hypothetical protein